MEKFKLKPIDEKILYELSLEARMSISDLAKRVKKSKQLVSYRVHLLEKNKIILGYYAILDPYKLGRNHYRIWLKYQMDSETEKSFHEFLLSLPELSWLVILDGPFDIGIAFWERDVSHLASSIEKIKKNFGTYFQNLYFSIAPRIDFFKNTYFFEEKTPVPPLIFGDCYENLTLDVLDRKLISTLSENGRISLVALANMYSTSAKVIKSRIDRLISRKIILGFQIKINHGLLGYTHRKVFLQLQDQSPVTLKKITTYLSTRPEILYFVYPIGNVDFEFECMTQTNEDFHQLIRSLRLQFPKVIKSVDSEIFYFELKAGSIIWKNEEKSKKKKKN